MSPYNPRGTGLFPEPTSFNGTPDQYYDSPSARQKPAECDCCGKVRLLSRCWTSCGIETFACDECRGVEPEELEP